MNLQIEDSSFGGDSYKPLLVVRGIVRYPLVFVVVILALFITIAGVGLSGYAGIDRKISSFRVTNQITDEYDAFDSASLFSSALRVNSLDSTNDSHIPYRYRILGTLQFYYHSKTGNIFTEQGLKDVRAIESKFINSLGYSDRCLLEWKDYRTTPSGVFPLSANESRVQCAPPRSSMNLFYPTLNASAEHNNIAMTDIYDFDGAGSRLYRIKDITNYISFDAESKWFVSRNFNMWNQTSSVLRTEWNFGYPLDGTIDSAESQKKQLEEFSKWIVPFSSKFSHWSTDNVRLLWEGTSITDSEVEKLVLRDTLFCIGSVLLVFFWMIFHLRSVVLAFCGMLNILLSIPVGHFVTHTIMGNKYLGFLMTLPIFIILGIGCEDIFVFYDFWNASATQGYHISGKLETRIDWTYRKAVSSMLVTSITAAGTFFIAAFSPVTPIRLFGIAMGTTILANFVLVTTFFPAILVLWHRYLEHRFNWAGTFSFLDFWWKPAANAGPDSTMSAQNPTSIIVSMSDVSIVQDVKDGEDLKPQPLPELELDKHPYFSKKKRARQQQHQEDVEAGVSTDNDDDDAEKAITVVKRNEDGVKVIIELEEEPLPDPWKLKASGRCFYFDFVPLVHGLRWFIVVLALVLLILCFAAAFYLQPHRGAPRLFPVGSNLNDFSELQNNVFSVDSSSFGEIYLVWGIKGIDRSASNLYDPDAVGNTTWDTSFDLASVETQNFLVDTFEKAKVATFLKTDPAERLAHPDFSLHKSFITAFKTYRLARNQSFPVEDPNEFWRSLKIWLSTDGNSYSTYLGWTTESSAEQQSMLWCSLMLRSSISQSTSPLVTLKNSYNSWKSFMDTIGRTAPKTGRNGYITSEDFVWMMNESALVRQAAWGTLGAVVVAFVLLLLVTWNVLVSLYSTLCIGFVVLLVVGFMSAAGWDLDIMEFVSLTIVVGLSIGYNVHMSMSYLNYARHSMLKDKPRLAIVQYAMAEIGSSVLSGSITTATSVIMLFFCKIILFSHFGKFIFINTVASLLTSFFLLVVLFLLIGPRADYGSLQGILAWHKERRRKAREKARLKERLKAAQSIDHIKENKNYLGQEEDDDQNQEEMAVYRTPSKPLVENVHGLRYNDSSSTLGSLGGTPMRVSVSMSDFELNLDDDDTHVPQFNLDESIASSVHHLDESDESDDSVALDPIDDSSSSMENKSHPEHSETDL